MSAFVVTASRGYLRHRATRRFFGDYGTRCVTPSAEFACGDWSQHVVDAVPDEGDICERCVGALDGDQAVVYRIFNATGELLYVGCTRQPITRIPAHAKRARWWPFAKRITFEWHDTYLAACAHEAIAIADERPLYNVRGVS